MTTINTRSENRVVRRARPRATGFNESEISQSMSSTRTADSAMVAENATATIRLKDAFRTAPMPDELDLDVSLL